MKFARTGARLGIAGIAFFTLKGLAWLALAVAGASGFSGP